MSQSTILKHTLYLAKRFGVFYVLLFIVTFLTVIGALQNNFVPQVHATVLYTCAGLDSAHSACVINQACPSGMTPHYTNAPGSTTNGTCTSTTATATCCTAPTTGSGTGGGTVGIPCGGTGSGATCMTTKINSCCGQGGVCGNLYCCKAGQTCSTNSGLPNGSTCGGNGTCTNAKSGTSPNGCPTFGGNAGSGADTSCQSNYCCKPGWSIGSKCGGSGLGTCQQNKSQCTSGTSGVADSSCASSICCYPQTNKCSNPSDTCVVSGQCTTANKGIALRSCGTGMVCCPPAPGNQTNACAADGGQCQSTCSGNFPTKDTNSAANAYCVNPTNKGVATNLICCLPATSQNANGKNCGPLQTNGTIGHCAPDAATCGTVYPGTTPLYKDAGACLSQNNNQPGYQCCYPGNNIGTSGQPYAGTPQCTQSNGKWTCTLPITVPQNSPAIGVSWKISMSGVTFNPSSGTLKAGSFSITASGIVCTNQSLNFDITWTGGSLRIPWSCPSSGTTPPVSSNPCASVSTSVNCAFGPNGQGKFCGGNCFVNGPKNFLYTCNSSHQMVGTPVDCTKQGTGFTCQTGQGSNQADYCGSSSSGGGSQTLTVNPSSLTPSQCTKTGNTYSCTVTLSETANSNGNINWNSVARPAINASFSPPTGTLSPGKSVTIKITNMNCTNDSAGISFSNSSIFVFVDWLCGSSSGGGSCSPKNANYPVCSHGENECGQPTFQSHVYQVTTDNNCVYSCQDKGITAACSAQNGWGTCASSGSVCIPGQQCSNSGGTNTPASDCYNGVNVCCLIVGGANSYRASITVTNPGATTFLASRVLAAQAIVITDNITLINPATNTFSNPTFKLSNLPPGQYNLYLHVNGFLDKQLTQNGSTTFTISAGQTTFSVGPVQLTPGDIAPQPNGDNVIDIQDYSAVIGCLNLKSSSAPTATCINPKAADLNHDGVIDQKDVDIVIVTAHIRQRGDSPSITASGTNPTAGQSTTPSGPQTFKCVTDPACAGTSKSIQLCPLKCSPQ